MGRNPEGHLAPALDACEAARAMRGKIGCLFNSNTGTSAYTKQNGKKCEGGSCQETTGNVNSN